MRRWQMMAVVGGLALVLAGCGDDGSTPLEPGPADGGDTGLEDVADEPDEDAGTTPRTDEEDDAGAGPIEDAGEEPGPADGIDPGGGVADAVPRGLPDATTPEEAWTPPGGEGGVAPACKTDEDCPALTEGGQCVQPKCHLQSATCFVGAAAEGKPCDDDDACTTGDGCAGGACLGSPVTCDDGDPCTTDVCRPEEGCGAEPATGAACDDGDPCTTGDACGDDGCAGVWKSCDDGDPCTLDACAIDSGACVHIHDPDACEDDPPDPPPAGDCCEVHDEPGCEDEATEACVCALDAFCCEASWDSICVGEAGGCGACGGGGTPVESCGDGACAGGETCESCEVDCGACPDVGDCCTATPVPGCADEAIEACVCDDDPFCCDNAWDAICVSGAGVCGACGGDVVEPEPFCGDGACDPDEGCGSCPADCGACAPVCGDGQCTGDEDCASCATDCGACPAADCCAPQTTPGCDDGELEACVCALDGFCCETAWDALCVGQAKDPCGGCAGDAPHCGDGDCGGVETCATCPDDCGVCDDGGGDECATPAALEIVTLDAWAQPLPAGTEVSLVGPDGPIALPVGTITSAAICGSAAFELEVSAPNHHDLAAALVYDGSAGLSGMSVVQAAGEAGLLVTTELRLEGDVWVRVYTVWVGLVHRWFAATGPPARYGNHVDLLRDGEEAWASVHLDLEDAQELVTATTWWWTSELELIRDPETHPYLPESERWKYTILGVMEALGWSGVESYVLVNQFYSQDGFLSWITTDDELDDHATEPGDGIEVMGQANEVSGTFTATLPEVDFGDRVLASWDAANDGWIVSESTIAPVHGPEFVDISELPLGFGALDLPVASWHQKSLTVDREVAFVGGMNIKVTDWDTHEHGVFEHRRMAYDASLEERLEVLEMQAETSFLPRKDYMVRVAGPSAADAYQVFADRWHQQQVAGAEYSELTTPLPPAKVVAPKPGGVQAQIVATMPAPHDRYEILETMVRAIGQAEEYIFIEDQYLRAPILADAIMDRLDAVPDLRVLIINGAINEWFDPGCYQTYIEAEQLLGGYPDRVAAYQVMSYAHRVDDCIFCIDETDAFFVPHSLHSKLVLIDDRYLQTGSANHNNRGLLYEGELSVVVVDDDVALQARHEIFANLLGPWYSTLVQPEDFLAAFEMAGWVDLVAYEAWDAEGFDLDLDGEPVPGSMIPSGLVYPLEYGSPDECLIEGVGEDVT